MNKSGFTIVELLIVIVVIGILAAITMVSYNGIQNRAHDVAAQSDLKQAHTMVELHVLDTGVYPSASRENEHNRPHIGELGIDATTGSYSTAFDYNFVYCPPYPHNTSTNFAFIGASKSGKLFVHSSSRGSYVYEGTETMNDYVDVCIDATPMIMASLMGIMKTSGYT